MGCATNDALGESWRGQVDTIYLYQHPTLQVSFEGFWRLFSGIGGDLSGWVLVLIRLEEFQICITQPKRAQKKASQTVFTVG